MPGHAKILKYLVILIGTLATLFWLATLQQPLIDQHEFRQTQTALTALFLKPDLHGFLNYETPVLGSPWSIPFELPLYQWLASLPPRLFPISLSASGRLISALFGLACLWPMLGMMRTFAISLAGRQIFAILYLTSSIYLYWNRSFMIESTALFLTLLSLYCYVLLREPSPQADASHSRSAPWLYAAFFLTLSLALLVKATTALPAFLLVGLDLIGQFASTLRSGHFRERLPKLLIIAAGLALAFLILRSWTHHADALKLLNPVGQGMTSKALQGWNFGSLSQRFSAELWDGVLLQRMLTPWGALPAIALLLLGWITAASNPHQKRFLALCLFLAFAPLLIFTNLHVQHNYYQSANQIYLLAALATAGSLALAADRAAAIRLISAALIILFVIGNLVAFNTTTRYYPDAFAQESTKLDIGRLIQRNTSPDSVLLVFDDDWSSAFAFHSARRALTVPGWFQDGNSRRDLLSSSASWLGGRPLGAVITSQPLDEAEQAALKGRCGEAPAQRFPGWTVYLCSPSTPGMSVRQAP